MKCYVRAPLIRKVDIAGSFLSFVLTNTTGMSGFLNSVDWLDCSLDAFLGFNAHVPIHSFNSLIDIFFPNSYFGFITHPHSAYI